MKSISFSPNWGDSNALRLASPLPDLDVPVPGIDEIVGWSQREGGLEVLEENMRRHKMGSGRLQMVPRSPVLRPRSARGLLARLRAHAHVRYRVSNICDVIP